MFPPFDIPKKIPPPPEPPPCSCHQGSVCGPACEYGAHHDGCGLGRTLEKQAHRLGLYEVLEPIAKAEGWGVSPVLVQLMLDREEAARAEGRATAIKDAQHLAAREGADSLIMPLRQL